MGLIAKNTGNGGDFVLPPTGTSPAICTQVIDLGTQYSKYYDTSKHKLLLGWELPDAESGDSEHAVIVFKRYTLSLHENSNLRKDLEAWRAKTFSPDELDGFDVSKILAKACFVNISHRQDGDKTYADGVAVMALPKGTPKPKSTTEHLLFNIDKPDMAVFEKFGDKLQATIKKAEEWGDNGQPAPVDPVSVKFPDDDSIPF